MALSLGSALATKVYLGATEINLAYFGATQVYTSSAFSAEAQNYFDRLDTAGDTTYVDYKLPLANYIDGLVTLGGAYWDTAKTAGSFVGVGIQGITIPLRDGMPTLTNNNFIAGDLDQLAGLKGDGSTKWITTGTFDGDTALNDVSISIWITESPTLTYRAFFSSGALEIDQGNLNQCGPNSRNVSSNNVNVTILNYMGHTRTGSTSYDYRFNGLTGTLASTSNVYASQDMTLFGRGTGASAKGNPRIAAYHYGPALNDATLEALQATLLSEVAAAKGAAAAANYFARLDTAGDTTYVAYKQPLTNYISSLVALGGAYWDDMKSAASFVGVGIQGITVPLRDGMTVPSQNNFVAGDLDVLTGLKGDGLSKSINTNFDPSTLTANDISASVYVTTDRELGVGRYAESNNRVSLIGNATGIRSFWGETTLRTLGTSTSLNGLIGCTRNNSANYDWYNVDESGTQAATSSAILTNNLIIYSRAAGGVFGNARLATYHCAPALNLATLGALQDTLITEIAAI